MMMVSKFVVMPLVAFTKVRIEAFLIVRAKGLAFQEGYKSAWLRMTHDYPEILQGSSNKYQSWELVDPEKWVPDGYAIVRVDSRGAGASPGYLEVWSPRETQDLYDCIEWA